MKPTINKGGKAPISQKSSQMDNNVAKLIPGAPKSLTDLPQNCMEELRTNGLEARWIDAVELKKNHGYHKQEWQPYKFKCLVEAIKTNPFMDAASGFEGYLIRKQLVLAVKTTEEADKQRNYLKFKNNMQMNPGQKAVKEFKEFAQGAQHLKVEEWDEKDEKDT